MVVQKPDVDSFTQFATANEAKLRHALIATCGGEVGREAAVEALAYGWEHWERLRKMDSPRDLEMTQQEETLVESSPSQPSGDFLAALAGVA